MLVLFVLLFVPVLMLMLFVFLLVIVVALVLVVLLLVHVSKCKFGDVQCKITSQMGQQDMICL